MVGAGDGISAMTPRHLILDAIGLACLVAAFLTIWSLTP